MRYLILCCGLLAGFQAVCQPAQGFRPVHRIPGAFSVFTVDNLGNIYAITLDNQLQKFNANGDSVGVFNEVRKHGKLTRIDVTNPLKALLFYRDFRTIVVLDRMLNLVNTIDLRKQGLFQVRAVAQSYDNNVWLFDEQESRLRKIGEDCRKISETAELRMVLEEAPAPVSLFDQNGFVWLYDPLLGMFVFDYYGALKNRLDLIGWTDVQVIGNTVFGRKEGKLLRYTVGTLDLREIPLPPFIQSATHLHLDAQGVVVLDENGITRYAYTSEKNRP